MSVFRLSSILCFLSFVAAATAAPPVFPPVGSEKPVLGELVEADFIHRTGKFRTPGGELRHFTMPPYAIMTWQGAESDLRDVPLGSLLYFLLVPDEDGQLTRLVGTKHGTTPDETQQKKFVDFTKARGLAGWIERTAGRQVTITFFSSAPSTFPANWGEAFDKGAAVTVCVANDELRTWQPTSCGERGTIVETETVPIAGHGCSGRRVVIQVNNMLEGFRQGRVVRVFGAGWKVRNQLFQECLINYGYSQQPAPDFRECLAKHYPEQFPFRTDYSNRHLPWFQIKDETATPPMNSEHRLFGKLTRVESADQSGEFRVEGSDEVVKFTMLNSGPRNTSIRFQSSNREAAGSRLSSLELGLRYRFHMYQDTEGDFTRCAFITDDYSQLALNSLHYQIRSIDLDRGRLEVAWQANPVKNYNGDMETPPPYGHSLLRVVPATRVWKDKAPAELSSLKTGDLLRVNLTAEFPGKPAHCADIWITTNTR
jgi:hypothetical protein